MLCPQSQDSHTQLRPNGPWDPSLEMPTGDMAGSPTRARRGTARTWGQSAGLSALASGSPLLNPPELAALGSADRCPQQHHRCAHTSHCVTHTRVHTYARHTTCVHAHTHTLTLTHPALLKRPSRSLRALPSLKSVLSLGTSVSPDVPTDKCEQLM